MLAGRESNVTNHVQPASLALDVAKSVNVRPKIHVIPKMDNVIVGPAFPV